MFATMRKYGWIAVLAVVLIVGGAAFNEYRKAQTRAAAEAAGDAILTALSENDPAARIAALKAVDVEGAEADMVARFLAAAQQAADGDGAGASETLMTIANGGSDIPEFYRQIALFKAIVAAGTAMDQAERRVALESLAVPGAPLSLLAQEQLALLDIETGDAGAALERLQRIVADASATPGLRRRSTQLIVALGGEPAGNTPSQ
nr:hypothetical protein [Shimia biformata]